MMTISMIMVMLAHIDSVGDVPTAGKTPLLSVILISLFVPAVLRLWKQHMLRKIARAMIISSKVDVDGNKWQQMARTTCSSTRHCTDSSSSLRSPQSLEQTLHFWTNSTYLNKLYISNKFYIFEPGQMVLPTSSTLEPATLPGKRRQERQETMDLVLLSICVKPEIDWNYLRSIIDTIHILIFK